MTVFDYTFLGLVGVLVLMGFWRGFVSEVLALVTWVAAFFLARAFGSVAASLFSSVIADPRVREIVGYGVVFVLILLASGVLRFILRELLKAAGLGFADRFLGACFGLVKAVIIGVVLVAIGGMFGISRAPWWQTAVFAPPLEMAVIASKPWLPQAVANKLRFR